MRPISMAVLVSLAVLLWGGEGYAGGAPALSHAPAATPGEGVATPRLRLGGELGTLNGVVVSLPMSSRLELRASAGLPFAILYAWAGCVGATVRFILSESGTCHDLFPALAGMAGRLSASAGTGLYLELGVHVGLVRDVTMARAGEVGRTERGSWHPFPLGHFIVGWRDLSPRGQELSLGVGASVGQQAFDAFPVMPTVQIAGAWAL